MLCRKGKNKLNRYTDEQVHLWRGRLIAEVTGRSSIVASQKRSIKLNRSSIVASQKRSIKLNRYIYFRVCLWVRRPLDELTGNCMLSSKGQCKWTCRLTPFRIAFILLQRLVISINNSSFIWFKLFSVYRTNLWFVHLVAKFTHKRRNHYSHLFAFILIVWIFCVNHF